MPPIAMLSEERIQDSGDDESSGSPETVHSSKVKSRNTKDTQKSKPSVKPSAIDSLLEDTSSDESDASKSSSRSSTSSTSAGSKRKAAESTKTIPNPPAKKPKTNLTSVKRVESSTYTPPQGYTANKIQPSEISSQAQSIFKDLEGKQIWQISAPASFPISKLESLDIQAALSGEPLLQHKGVSYTMSRGDSSETALLIPKPNGDYVRAATISRVFNIREKSDTTMRLRNGTSNGTESSQTTQRDDSAAVLFNSNIFFATKTGHKKPPRKQPENLKARYIPYGVVTEARTKHEEVQDSDTAMAGVSPQPAQPSQTNSQITPKSTKKSKTMKANSPEIVVEETPSKRKKEKNALSSSQGELQNESSQKKRKEKSKK